MEKQKPFSGAQWIWIDNVPKTNEYVEFIADVSANRSSTICRLSCDGDYTLFVNGTYVASNQYGDFEYYKIYDEIDISAYSDRGKNEIKILVWHFGEDSQRYAAANAGLIFEIVQGGQVCVESDTSILCRRSPFYKSEYEKIITSQLGFSFLYDATKAETPFSNAVIADKRCTLFPRPIQKSKVGERVKAEILKNEGKYYLIDLGKETVGLPVLSFLSNTEQKIRVDYGEDLQNGHVRRLIDGRDFSFEYIAKKGENLYTNYMLRLACRYLEVYAEDPIEVEYIGLLPQRYPVQARTVRLKDATEQKIYDMCLNTLRLCMMEHYVDCPWREQCLYVFDSRNQMLCGYYAFERGNAEYARSNLKLIGEDRRSDQLLSICYPCGADLTIPSFSLYYFMAVREYIEHTGDFAFAEEIYEKLLSVLEAFIANRKNGLVCKFEGENHWNFYDWSAYLDGALFASEAAVPDCMINILFIIALQNLEKIDGYLQKEFRYNELLEETKRKTKETFFTDKGLYTLTSGKEEYTTLANALAILSGLTDRAESERICDALINGETTECSLSMKTFKYDALLFSGSEKRKGQVLDEIRADYQKMLDENSSTVWETSEGAAAFDNAGSLCHGWSAIPIYYYHKLNRVIE